MAGGWTRDGAVSDQIDDTIADSVSYARARLASGEGTADCIECGCCDYVCPSQIPLTARFHAARLRMQLHDAERQRATEARGRFERHERRLAEQAEAERLAFEAARRRARGAGPT